MRTAIVLLVIAMASALACKDGGGGSGDGRPNFGELTIECPAAPNGCLLDCVVDITLHAAHPDAEGDNSPVNGAAITPGESTTFRLLNGTHRVESARDVDAACGGGPTQEYGSVLINVDTSDDATILVPTDDRPAIARLQGFDVECRSDLAFDDWGCRAIVQQWIPERVRIADIDLHGQSSKRLMVYPTDVQVSSGVWGVLDGVEYRGSRLETVEVPASGATRAYRIPVYEILSEFHDI